VFDPRLDTLRLALDSALTSPVGLAVAVSRDTGRYLGVVDADEILAHVREARATVDAPAGEPAVGVGAASEPPSEEQAEEAPADEPAGEDTPADETAAEDALGPGMPAEVVAPEHAPADAVLTGEVSAHASDQPPPDEEGRS
jgi:osmoprotectant transport system ATP-binding protein